MSASSVTGVGLGDSNGKQKPQNHSSCGCCFQQNLNKIENKKNKNNCFIKYRQCSVKNNLNYSKIIVTKSCI